jgi:hypothetical protein
MKAPIFRPFLTFIKISHNLYDSKMVGKFKPLFEKGPEFSGPFVSFYFENVNKKFESTFSK